MQSKGDGFLLLFWPDAVHAYVFARGIERRILVSFCKLLQHTAARNSCATTALATSTGSLTTALCVHYSPPD